MRVGMFVDIDDTFKHVGGKFHHKKLNYRKLYEYVKGLGELTKAMAYGITMGTEAVGFLKILHEIGFETKYIKTNRTNNNTQRVNLTVDILGSLEDFQKIVLVASNLDYLPLCQKLSSWDKNVIIIGSNISEKFEQYAMYCIEIPISWLEIKEKKS